jgi:hypothetical protein
MNTKAAVGKPLSFGLALAPLATPITYSIWAIFFFTDTTPKLDASGFSSETIAGWATVLMLLTLLSYAASALFGIPLILALKRAQKISFWWVVLPSAPLGAIAFVGLFVCMLATDMQVRGSMELAILQFAGVGAAFGLAVATTFCWLTGLRSHSSQ